MYILNKRTKIIQECNNSDVIKVAKKDTEQFAVSESKDELLALLNEKASLEKEVIDNTEVCDSKDTEEDEESSLEDEEESTNDEQVGAEATDYESMNIDELKKIAKEKGIQGYSNMNKATLVEVIKAHE